MERRESDAFSTRNICSIHLIRNGERDKGIEDRDEDKQEKRNRSDVQEDERLATERKVYTMFLLFLLILF